MMLGMASCLERNKMMLEDTKEEQKNMDYDED